MKTEYKMEGMNLVLGVSEDVKVDGDKDGVASVTGGLSLNLTLNGLEIADELLKSSDLAKKIKEKLVGLGLIKEDAPAPAVQA
jgi:hypothetical protein